MNPGDYHNPNRRQRIIIDHGSDDTRRTFFTRERWKTWAAWVLAIVAIGALIVCGLSRAMGRCL